MKKKNPVKIIIIGVLSAALLAGGAFGGVKLAQSRGGEVNVYPVSSFSTSAEWMNSVQTDGLVSTDRIQSVYLSSTQQITEIYVEEGQTVKAGDPILAFDTTLSELELERQDIKVQQLRLDIENEEKRLQEIGTYRVGSPSSYTPTYNPPVYSEAPYMPYDRAPEAAGTMSDPLIWLWNDGCTLDEAFFLRAAAIAAANREAAREKRDEPAETEEPSETEAPVETDAPPETEAPTGTEETVETELPVEDKTPPETEEGETDPDEDPSASAPMDPIRLMTRQDGHTRLLAEDGAPMDPEPEDLPDELDDPYIYVVFEIRTDDAENGEIERVYEMMLYVDGETGDWNARLIAPSYDPGGEVIYDDGGYVIDTNVYYTAAEIAQMKAECIQKLGTLRIDLKAAELEYERLSYELSNGEVVSKIDGVVKTVRDPDEARAENKPVVLVSGGGGYYVTALLGELSLGTVQVGDTVTAMSWETGQQLEGVITEISEYPDESGQFYFYSEGNQNVSSYPFKVFIDEDAELREGEYVTVNYGGGEADDGLYLETPFIRQESGRSYVYTVGDGGRLEKRYVRTGQNLWGSYVEILDGLTADDYVAFPYGRQTQDGAKVRYAEPDELWASVYGIG